MTRQLLLLGLITVASGCLKDRKQEDPLRPGTARASEPSARSKPIAAPASRISNPDDVRLAPTKMEDPATLDDRRRDERKDRRDERREERREPEKPKLPSPFAPKVETPKGEAPKAASGDLSEARRIYTIAAAQFDKLIDFEAILTRREVIGKTEQPTEEVLFQYRKKPFSIYMKTIGEVGRGREVLYVDGQHDGKMHVVIGEGDGGILMKPGSKMAFAPNSPLVTGKSRHKITEAGFGDSLAKFGKLITLAENGTRSNAIKSLGPVKRKESPYPLDGLELVLLPGDDPTLTKGGKKLVYFDLKDGSPSYGFPVLVITQDETGREVEYYHFDKFKNPANLSDADFNPDRLSSRKK